MTSIIFGTASSLILIALSPTLMVDIMGLEAAIFPLKNPAIVTMPASFALGVLVSVLYPDPVAAEKYDAKERRMIMGA